MSDILCQFEDAVSYYSCHPITIIDANNLILCPSGKRLFFSDNSPELVQTPRGEQEEANRGKDDNTSDEDFAPMKPKSLAKTFEYYSDAES